MAMTRTIFTRITSRESNGIIRTCREANMPTNWRRAIYKGYGRRIINLTPGTKEQVFEKGKLSDYE